MFAADDTAGLRLVELLIEAGELETAESRVREWVERGGSGPLARVALGRVHLAGGFPDRALEAFRAARESESGCRLGR